MHTNTGSILLGFLSLLLICHVLLTSQILHVFTDQSRMATEINPAHHESNNIVTKPFEWIAHDSNSSSMHRDAILQFAYINSRLIGPSDLTSLQRDVNPDLGMNENFPPFYTPQDIQASMDFMEENEDVLLPYVKQRLAQRKIQAAEGCQASSKDGEDDEVLSTGGWCLKKSGRGSFPHKNHIIYIPKQHVMASKRVANQLVSMIRKEGIQSINDFGAGVGQYKNAVLQKIPDFDYRAYDGAGNGVEYTHGFMDYFDLTLPLGLPKADWVFSLEVGEHVPSTYEGMVIRNLHRHNCKGIVLSWAILGQEGHSHVNNHSNEYILRVFESLGYQADMELARLFRARLDNYEWLRESVMVLRRTDPVC